MRVARGGNKATLVPTTRAARPQFRNSLSRLNLYKRARARVGGARGRETSAAAMSCGRTQLVVGAKKKHS